MSWLFSRVLVEEYLGVISSDGEQSVQSSGNPTQLAYCAPDKMTDFSRLSRFGMMFKPLTEDRGEELLMSYLEGFHVKTSPQPEKVQALTESEAECGKKWHGSFAKYDQDSSSWKTHQCSLLGGLDEFLETWPQWGLMRNGECWDQSTQNYRLIEIDCGLLPAPLATDWKETGKVERQAKDWENQDYGHQKRPAMFYASFYKESMPPEFEEIMMGWPLGWTDLKPLEMDKFQRWLDAHGNS